MKKCRIWFVLTGIFLLLLGNGFSVISNAKGEDNGCDIVFALDISGSMKSTDEHRSAIETIKMVIDLCDETDQVGLVAYNDTIAYCYDLTGMKTDEERKRLKEKINAIEYKGETDIGLGLRQAVDLFSGQQDKRNRMVILLSDGKTDLEYSNSGRTLEQSQGDLEAALGMAKERQIPIYTIGFASEYLEDGDYLTVISANTGGSTQMVATPLQLNQAIQPIIFAYKNGQNETTKVIDTTGENQVVEIEFHNEYVKKAYISVFSTGIIDEVYTELTTNPVLKSQKYAIIKCDNPIEKSFSLGLKANVGEKVIVNVIEVKGQAPTLTPTATPIPTKEPTKLPVTVTPVVVKDNSVQIKSVIAGICLFTVLVCLIIVYLFFGIGRKKETLQFQGKLIGQFIDLKSKNESIYMEWNLAEYPEEGVTLKELFAGVNFNEDLPEIDRLCFYPEKNNKMLLVHCMEGGVFLGDDNVSRNTPVKISSGDTIYVSFAENSSELELKYTL